MVREPAGLSYTVSKETETVVGVGVWVSAVGMARNAAAMARRFIVKSAGVEARMALDSGMQTQPTEERAGWRLRDLHAAAFMTGQEPRSQTVLWMRRGRTQLQMEGIG